MKKIAIFLLINTLITGLTLGAKSKIEVDAFEFHQARIDFHNDPEKNWKPVKTMLNKLIKQAELLMANPLEDEGINNDLASIAEHNLQAIYMLMFVSRNLGDNIQKLDKEDLSTGEYISLLRDQLEVINADFFDEHGMKQEFAGNMLFFALYSLAQDLIFLGEKGKK